MDSLLAVIDNIFFQIKGYLSQIDENQYSEKLEIFSGSSIGQHTRHIIEFFMCLTKQLETQTINYDTRERRKEIEENPKVASEELDQLSQLLGHVAGPTTLQLVTCYGHHQAGNTQIETTLERELLYNIEHAVHHLAMIKIGLKSVFPQVDLPDDFGVAQSTLSYRKQLPTP